MSIYAWFMSAKMCHKEDSLVLLQIPEEKAIRVFVVTSLLPLVWGEKIDKEWTNVSPEEVIR